MTAPFVKAAAAYVIVEPSIRNALQAGAGIVAIQKDALLLGVGLLVWALLDATIKALTGALLWRRSPTEVPPLGDSTQDPDPA